MFMSAIIMGTTLIFGTAIIIIFFIFLNGKKKKNRQKILLNIFNQAGADKGVVFSSQEILKDKIIGVDGIHHKLLIFNCNNSHVAAKIKLEDVISCSFKKEYKYVNYGNEKRTIIERQVSSIGLEFSFKSGFEPFLLLFYNDITDTIYEMAELEIKAKNWETMLSKMIIKDYKECL